MKSPPRKSLWYRRDGKPFVYYGPDLGPGWVAMMREIESHLIDLDYKRVRFDKLDNGLEISTVWLGLDHQYGGGPPLIFETMVFAPAHVVYSFGGRERVLNRTEFGDMDRYSTEAEAIAGHEKFLKTFREYRSVEQVLKTPTVDPSS